MKDDIVSYKYKFAFSITIYISQRLRENVSNIIDLAKDFPLSAKLRHVKLDV